MLKFASGLPDIGYLISYSSLDIAPHMGPPYLLHEANLSMYFVLKPVLGGQHNEEPAPPSPQLTRDSYSVWMMGEIKS